MRKSNGPRKPGKTKSERAIDNRDRALRKNYGISLSEYETMLARQEGKCPICDSNFPGGKGTWQVDHCHTTGVVRGLLCHHCNLLLGHAKDSVRCLKQAIHYLQSHHSPVTVDVTAFVGTPGPL